MSLRHGLLGLLNYEPMTGYQLNKMFNESLGHFWQAKASQIYRELDAMEQSGWLTSERVIQDDKPNKRVYSITDSGKAEFLDWLSALDPLKNPPRLKSALLMRVFFGGELDLSHTLSLFHSLREVVVEIAKPIQAIGGEIDKMTAQGEVDANTALFWKLAALNGEISFKASIEWVDKSIQILEEEKEKRQ